MKKLIKSRFENFMFKNLGKIDKVHCIIWEGYDINNEEACWFEIFVKDEYDEYISLFSSDYYALDDNAVVKLQKDWVKKLNTWINPNWGVELVVDRISV